MRISPLILGLSPLWIECLSDALMMANTNRSLIWFWLNRDLFLINTVTSNEIPAELHGKRDIFTCENNMLSSNVRNIINNLPVASRSIILPKLKAEANNWFAYLREAKQSAIFHARAMARRRKRGFVYIWAEYYLQPNTAEQHCTWADHYF